ncbi:glycosyltransferase family 87 protein [Paraburkholderia caffeinilytica]|uniref:glycosyltransferase family 87 protein n=1 Tax=Paraburkholderia caffeinilytica TaxID=1761016 RepID=UPI000E21A355|nr:glycosyltransferase family 87 protein [Paraburkholderia caffeinilytica]CAB3790552.1 hypothetical protein LMG28690_03112 [Paraburkholderia caffeinilytica]
MKNIFVWSTAIIVLNVAILSKITIGIDFVVFWKGAVAALQHGPDAVFNQDLNLLRARALEPSTDFMELRGPWLYPPPFLLFIIPFGLLTFKHALVLFTCIGVAVYVYSLRQVLRPLSWTTISPFLAFPGVALAIWYGQNSLLTMACAALGLALLPSRPIVAGLFIALVSVKPQFGVLFPIVLICDRQWKAFFSAAIGTIVLWSVSTFVLGFNTFTEFIKTTIAFRVLWIENFPPIWHGMPTFYGLVRLLGGSATLAYTIQGILAASIVIVVSAMWRSSEIRYELKCVVASCGVIAIQPYIVYYDIAWLALPIAFMFKDMCLNGSSKLERAALFFIWLSPVQAVFAVVYPPLLHWTPIVLLGMIWMSVSRARSTKTEEKIYDVAG